MSRITTFFEGMFLDDWDNTVMVQFVDVRHPSARRPIVSLIKGSEQRYAIDRCKNVRISKPAYFRTSEEGLIHDRYEALADRAMEIALDEDLLTTKDPKLRQLVGDFHDQLTKGLGEVELKQLTHKLRYRQTDQTVFGANGWLFSTSIEPTTPHEWRRWKASISESYDHVSYIHQPRAFARSLGLMVAEQLGPQGGEAEMDHSFGELEKSQTRHTNQIIIHGPVVYVADLYKALTSAPPTEAYLRSIFVKQLGAEREINYDAQREYRFWIQANDEPDEQIVYLNASPALIDAMQPSKACIIERVE